MEKKKRKKVTIIHLRLYFLNMVIDVATDDYEEESLLQVAPREGLRMLDQLVFVTGICE